MAMSGGGDATGHLLNTDEVRRRRAIGPHHHKDEVRSRATGPHHHGDEVRREELQGHVAMGKQGLECSLFSGSSSYVHQEENAANEIK
ncbi:unnamed protein product [Arctogadus glacialis]